MDLQFTFIDSLKRIQPADWQTLSQGAGPFLDYAFLTALETQHCVGGQSGWQPWHLQVEDKQGLVALLPLYKKWHSYGEYVFDFAWADAFARHGHEYYPKLVAGIPFTPVPGPRLLTRQNVCLEEIWPRVLKHLQKTCQTQSLSSVHILFCQIAESDRLAELGAAQRHSVQFHWFNRGYTDFNDFVARFTSRKRKNLQKERRRLSDAGITFHRLTGSAISTEHIHTFYQCYRQTYLKRSGHNGYLNEALFEDLLRHMGEKLLLVQARRDGNMLASALFFFDQQGLYGRYWGCLNEIDGLHFEVCYYQGIEFCIERKLAFFNPGTQGEHKIQRGFEPVICYSNHWLTSAQFYTAVKDFIVREKQYIFDYQKDTSTLLPFSQRGRE